MSSWRRALDEFFQVRGEQPHSSRSEALVEQNTRAADFIDHVVIPAFEQVADALAAYGRQVFISRAYQGRSAASLQVRYEGRGEFEYLVEVRVSPEQAIPYARVTDLRHKTRNAPETALWSDEPKNHAVTEVSQERVLQHVLAAYQASMPM